MDKDTFKDYSVTRVAIPRPGILLSLYDLLGYLTPGLIFVSVTYFLTYWAFPLPPELMLSNISSWLNSWYGIIGILVSSYIVGHAISGLSKVIERTCCLCNFSLTRYLLLGDPNSFIFSFKGMSPGVLKRFIYNYSHIILNRRGLSFDYSKIKDEEPREQLEDLLKETGIKITDILWDCSIYLINEGVAGYNSAYSFLSFSGFFRTLSVVWLLLCLIPIVCYFYNLMDGARAFVICCILLVLSFLCFLRYLKFERMFVYHILRTFSLLLYRP